MIEKILTIWRYLIYAANIDKMVMFDIRSTRIFYEQAANAIHLNWQDVSKNPDEEKVMIPSTSRFHKMSLVIFSVKADNRWQ